MSEQLTIVTTGNPATCKVLVGTTQIGLIHKVNLTINADGADEVELVFPVTGNETIDMAVEANIRLVETLPWVKVTRVPLKGQQ